MDGCLSSQELAILLQRKTANFAIRWAKKENISYLRKGSGRFGRYWFNTKEVKAKLKTDGQIITAKEVTKILGVCRGTLGEWVRQDYLKPIGRGERNTLLFKKANISRFRPKTRFWAPWQKTLLEVRYNEKGFFYEKIAQGLGKSPAAVQSKIFHLGITKGKQRTFYLLRDVADFFGTNRYRVSKWIKSQKLETIPQKSSGGRIIHKISLEQIAQFMILYPKAWQGLTPLINLPELPEYTKLNKNQKAS